MLEIDLNYNGSNAPSKMDPSEIYIELLTIRKSVNKIFRLIANWKKKKSDDCFETRFIKLFLLAIS